MILRKPWLASAAVLFAVLGGCSTLDQKQREWIFQPSDRSWNDTRADDMAEQWIEFQSKQADGPARLHALWMPAADDTETAPIGAASPPPASASRQPPVMLYLHGARWNVVGSAPRIRRMQELGFSVLAIDYRGFGKSGRSLPSESSAAEDARAAWDWLGQRYPGRARYIMGHSLGGAIAIDLASQVGDERGTVVEGTFSNIPDVISSFRYGWLPVSWLITQRFDSIEKVKKIGAPLLVVHGSNDTLIPHALAKKLYEAAPTPKRFVLVEGGSHHSTQQLGLAQYRTALRDLFGVGAGI